MSKIDVYFWLMISLIALLNIVLWFQEIDIEPQYIPTILNGLVSCTSIIVGFAMALIALMIRKESSKPIQPFYGGMISLLIVPLFLLLIIYFILATEADLHLALKLAITNLSIALFPLLYIIHKYE